MKFEALCALLLIRGQQGLVSESVWVGVGGQMSGPNVSPGDWEMRADTLERRMVKATRAILTHRDLSHPALFQPLGITGSACHSGSRVAIAVT